MRPKYKIISKVRFSIFIITIVIMFTAFIFFLIDKKEAYNLYYFNAYEESQVLKGDTIWDIAKRHLKPGNDIREMVYDIRKLNNLDTGYIYPGDTIKIPTD